MPMSSTSPQASPAAPLAPSTPVEPLPPPPSPRPRLQEREASCLAERALALSNSSRMAATSAASRSSFFPEAMARKQSRSTSSRWSLARCFSALSTSAVKTPSTRLVALSAAAPQAVIGCL